MNRRHFRLATGLLAIGVLCSAEPARARPVVVELFTSQGCSSCPPAEALLNDLARRADVLPLSFHVTYWNRLGWTDTLSFEGATQRQAAYAARLDTGSFTPQMVIDGRASAVGSRRGEVEAALARKGGASAEVGLVREGGTLKARIGPGTGQARILLVGFDRQRTTPIGRGENRGRTIVQSNVVRSIRTIGVWTGKAMALTAPAPDAEDAAILLESTEGGIVGAARIGS